jgi:hypothetical protein
MALGKSHERVIDEPHTGSKAASGPLTISTVKRL